MNRVAKVVAGAVCALVVGTGAVNGQAALPPGRKRSFFMPSGSRHSLLCRACCSPVRSDCSVDCFRRSVPPGFR